MRETWSAWGLLLHQTSQVSFHQTTTLHMYLLTQNTHTHASPPMVGDFKHSSGDIGACRFSPRFSIYQSPFPHTVHWLLVKDDLLKSSVPRLFLSPLYVVHFSVMGNKMWLQACCRSWMIPPVQDLGSLCTDMNHWCFLRSIFPLTTKSNIQYHRLHIL